MLQKQKQQAASKTQQQQQLSVCVFVFVNALTCRSSATRFRWIQNYYGEQDEWALDDIYIGQQCPSMCHGHGWCDHGHCRSVRTVSIVSVVTI